MLLEAVDQPLYDVALPIRDVIEARLWDFIALRWDDDSDPTTFQVVAHCRAAVALIARNPVRSNPWSASSWPFDRSPLHQGRQHWLLVAFSSGQYEHQRLAAALGPEMDLRAVAAAAPAKCLGRRVPPLARAAC